MAQQLVKKSNGGYENVMPKSWIDAIVDKSTGKTLTDILQSFNMYFLSYSGNTMETRCQVPSSIRKKGLWITYVKYDGKVYTEWYAASAIDDKSWGDSSNWRVANNTLVGDISISANGNWVINGDETVHKAIGERGDTPMLRVQDNKLQVSYDEGDTWTNVTENPVYTKFRWAAESNNVGRIQASTDNGATWVNMSNDFTNNLHIKKYIGADEALPSKEAEGTIYAKGPFYDDTDTLHEYPTYRLCVYAWKGNTLAWQDHGEFTSIAAGIVQEEGNNENVVMSQDAVTRTVNTLQDNILSSTGISEYPVFSNRGTYAIGDIVRHEGKLYKFIVEHELAAWNPDSVEEWSEKKEREELGQYEDNPEYARAYTDAEGRFLWGIKQDGSIEFAKGVPTPIKNYIVEFVFNRLTPLEEAHEQYLKESESPEWARVIVDADGKVLWGIKNTGEVFFGYGVPSQVIGYVEKVISDIGVESLIEGKVDKVNGKSLIDVDFAEGVRYSQNKEWVKALIDNEGKLLLAIGKDGNLFFGYGIPKQIIDYINKNISIIGINDVENRFQIVQDSDGDIVAFRDSEGKLNELAGIDTPYLKVKKLDAENVDSFRDITNLSEDDTIYCEKPKYGELWLEGDLPTDKSDARTPTNLKMTFKVSGITQFIGRCNLSIQGHGSTAYDKLGYTFEPVNANGEAINIKFGDMVATDSFHMKAYATDVVRCRDLGGYAIWRDMVKRLSYPANKFNNIPFELPTEYSKNKINIADANYVPLGFQTGVYLNGEFLGLYTIKHKKTRQNYAMDKNVKSQIFLDSINYKSWLKEGFDHTAWDLKNPKLKGYEEGDEISDAEVKGNIERLFNYLYQINPNDSSTYSNYQEYIVLPHWIAFLILIELVHGIDQVGNNINLMTWDATRWSIVPWDLDLSCGLVGGSKIIRSDESYYQQFSLRTQNTSTPNEMKFWPDFKKIFATEIKETWTMLRKSGFISEANIADYYKKEIDGIPRSVYEADFEKWGNIWANGIPTFEQLMLAIHYKIKWLDTQWLNNNN